MTLTKSGKVIMKFSQQFRNQSGVTAEQIALALGKARKVGREWACLCPIHGDSNPSLYLRDAGNGRILVHCFVCGRKGQSCIIRELVRLGLWTRTRRA